MYLVIVLILPIVVLTTELNTDDVIVFGLTCHTMFGACVIQRLNRLREQVSVELFPLRPRSASTSKRSRVMFQNHATSSYLCLQFFSSTFSGASFFFMFRFDAANIELLPEVAKTIQYCTKYLEYIKRSWND